MACARIGGVMSDRSIASLRRLKKSLRFELSKRSQRSKRSNLERLEARRLLSASAVHDGDWVNADDALIPVVIVPIGPSATNDTSGDNQGDNTGGNDQPTDIVSDSGDDSGAAVSTDSTDS